MVSKPIKLTPKRPVPATAEVVPDTAESLVAALTAEYKALAADPATDPFRNPVLMLAHRISQRLARTEVTHSDLAAAVQHLTMEGFKTRVGRLRRYLGEMDPHQNLNGIKTLVEALAKAPDGTVLPFEEFRKKVERESFGAVMTAHPTFNMSGEMMRAAADLASDRDRRGERLTEAAQAERIEAARAADHAPDKMTLEREHELSLEAIANMHGAMRQVYQAIFEVAEKLYPQRWTELTPRLMTVASWVGYDLDGRSDIGWTDTLHMRLRGQRLRLAQTYDEVQSIHRAAPAGGPLANVLAEIETRLKSALAEVTEEIAVFGENSPDPDTMRARIQDISRRIVAGKDRRLMDTTGLLQQLRRAVQNGGSPEVRRRLLVLRSELANSGLGVSHVHVRINASQLHNAVRKRIGIEASPDDARYRATYVQRLDKLLDEVQPVSINFGSIMAERASARRLFMAVAQMLKYIDGTTPVRFLIAESETAFTVLVAVYFAKLFGITDRIDISPLFETQRALDVGHRVIEQLLNNRHYREYVLKRGRICVQTGFSDAGRYLGQIPAAAAIERFRERLAKVVANQNLGNIEVVVFDTHGESVGRGGHPADLATALDYVNTPKTREAFRNAGVELKEEVSFQGGDGYLYFFNPVTALAAVSRIVEHTLRPPAPVDDPFYRDADLIREWFAGVTHFQVELTADPDYGALVGAFAPNFTYTAGSRSMVREREDSEAKAVMHITDMRAIPQNASLQQLGVLVNSMGGLGHAIAREPARFADIYRNSARMRALFGIAEYAVAVGSFASLGAYVETQNPGVWLQRSASAGSVKLAEHMRTVAELLERPNSHDRQHRVMRRLYRDYLDLCDGMALLDGPNDLGCARLVLPGTRTALAVLHALRVALIHEVYLLATQVPDFSPQFGTTYDRSIQRLLRLDVPGAVTVLEKVFSTKPPEGVLEEDYGEPATYSGDDNHTYDTEHGEVFGPLRELHEAIRKVSSAVIHYIGFLG